MKKAIEINSRNDKAYGALSVLYDKMGNVKLSKEYADKADMSRFECIPSITVNNYHKFKEILDKRGIRLVCVQYPMHSVASLKKIFQGVEYGIIFVDNEKISKEAVRKSRYNEYFRDMFGGDFGHCIVKGNRLLAENIANAIIKGIFAK